MNNLPLAPMTPLEIALDARLRDAWYDLSAAYQAVSAMRGALRQKDSRGLACGAQHLMHCIERAAAAFDAANQAYVAMKHSAPAEGIVQ